MPGCADGRLTDAVEPCNQPVRQAATRARQTPRATGGRKAPTLNLGWIAPVCWAHRSIEEKAMARKKDKKAQKDKKAKRAQAAQGAQVTAETAVPPSGAPRPKK